MPSGRLLAGIVAGILACARAPEPVFPGDIPFDVRVRVIAPDLAGSWHPARLIRSEDGCRMVTVATTRQRAPVVLLNMGQIRRLQLSLANPPRDWWTEPEEEEGWTEIDPARLRDENSRCRSRYPPDRAEQAAGSPPAPPNLQLRLPNDRTMVQ